MSDKVALVTGSAQRIGAAIVEHLHQAGFRVGIHYNRSKTEALALAKTLNAKRSDSAFTLQQDLREPKASENLVKALKQHSQRLDVLVNNASVFKRTPISEASLCDFDELFTLHVKLPYSLSLALSPLLAKQQGVIINITDIQAQTGLADYGLYCQSKAALDMQTKILAKELAPDIRVNAIAPGVSSLWPEGDNRLDAKTKQHIIASIPLQCTGSPRAIAEALLSLVENPFITGQILAVDGGKSL